MSRENGNNLANTNISDFFLSTAPCFYMCWKLIFLYTITQSSVAVSEALSCFLAPVKFISCYVSQLQSCSVTLNMGCATGNKSRVEETCLTGPTSRAPLRPSTRGPGRTTRWAPALDTISTLSPRPPRSSRTQLCCWAESSNLPISWARTGPVLVKTVSSVSITTCSAHMCSAWQFTSAPRL